MWQEEAGGGGCSNTIGGDGGGTTAVNAVDSNSSYGGPGGPGTQTSGGKNGTNSTAGTYGQGGKSGTTQAWGGAGRRPEAGMAEEPVETCQEVAELAGGGSGWVYTESNFNTWKAGNATDANKYELTSQYYLTKASTIAGNSSFTSPTGTSETGHSGNGYARITCLD